jgi:hypothetical protein
MEVRVLPGEPASPVEFGVEKGHSDMVRDPEPHGPMDEAAIAMHEMYMSFRRAGFSRAEATSIIAKTTAEMISAGMAEGEDSNEDG